MLGHHHVAHLNTGADTARHAGKHQFFDTKVLNQRGGGGGCCNFANTAECKHHVQPLEAAFDKVATCTAHFLAVGQCVRKAMLLFGQCTQNCKRHKKSQSMKNGPEGPWIKGVPPVYGAAINAVRGARFCPPGFWVVRCGTRSREAACSPSYSRGRTCAALPRSGCRLS